MQRLPKAILIREPQNICHLWNKKKKVAATHFVCALYRPGNSPPTSPLTIHYANFERVPFAANEEEVEGDATSRPAGEVVESASCEHKY